MTIAIKIAHWVEKKPLILIRFDEALSESLLNSRHKFEYLTIAKPHSVFQDFKLPTICLLEIHGADTCYLGTATRKTAVSTFDSRLTIKKLRPVVPSSLREIERRVTDTRMKRLLNDRLPSTGAFSRLSSKLSSHLIHLLAQEPENHATLEVALSQLPELRRTPNINWAQEDAIRSAMKVFGLRVNEVPVEVVLRRGAASGLSLVGTYMYEDNIVHADTSKLPGFKLVAQDITGRAVFEKRGERLVIYTANRLPLEKMLGVDLIYINETKGNIVMVQYKMLEEARNQDGSRGWQFRPDKQFWDEIARMKLPAFYEEITDYRLSRNPFFFKFVKRKVVNDSHQSFVISLDHLKQILTSRKSRGAKGGIRVSYEALDGTYLRESDFIGLICSGYVGTHRVETEALTTIISEVAKGDKALVLAWQRKVQSGGKDP
ncbi:MAG: hypothetical protein J7L69_12790 [Desulfobulbaceae bacterium]|nr:hypothetical protein [Desulfobulbaceae bacterium]